MTGDTGVETSPAVVGGVDDGALDAWADVGLELIETIGDDL